MLGYFILLLNVWKSTFLLCFVVFCNRLGAHFAPFWNSMSIKLHEETQEWAVRGTPSAHGTKEWSNLGVAQG